MNKDIPTDLLPSEYELASSSNAALTLYYSCLVIAATVVSIMSQKIWGLN
ncbi:MAG: hypothetical protein AB8U11_05600 [Rickettsia slovaca]